MKNRMMKWFECDHLDGEKYTIAERVRILAEDMDADLDEGPEKTTGLRKLLEAKDCFVRARIEGDTG